MKEEKKDGSKDREEKKESRCFFSYRCSCKIVKVNEIKRIVCEFCLTVSGLIYMILKLETAF